MNCSVGDHSYIILSFFKSFNLPEILQEFLVDTYAISENLKYKEIINSYGNTCSVKKMIFYYIDVLYHKFF